MSIGNNVQVVKHFIAAIASGDKERVLALVAEDIEWIIPGEDWPLAGTHRGHAGLESVLQRASEEIEMTYPKPPEFVAQFGLNGFLQFIHQRRRTFRAPWPPVVLHYKRSFDGILSGRGISQERFKRCLAAVSRVGLGFSSDFRWKEQPMTNSRALL